MFNKKKYLNKKFNVTIDDTNLTGRGICVVNGLKVFVDGVKKGDECRIKIYFANKKFMEAEVVEFFLKNSHADVKCPNFYNCGGCDYLHLTREEEKKIKISILEKAVGSVYSNFPKIKYIDCDEKRIRAKFNFKYKNNSYQCGFFKKKSNIITDVKGCIVFENRIIEYLYKINDVFNENHFCVGDFTLQITLLDNGIDIVIECFDDNIAFSPNMIDKISNATSIEYDVNIWHKNSNYYFPIIYRHDLFKTIGCKKIVQNKGRFLQPQIVGRLEIEKFIHFCMSKYLVSDSFVCDLFCGSASFSLGFGDSFKFDCYEVENESILALKNLNIPNINCHVRDLFEDPLREKELDKFSCVIVNPPRVGCEKQFINIVNSGIKLIIYVSCNYSSMISDFKKSGVENSYNIVELHIVNQFQGSMHYETLVLLKKK